MIVEQPPASVPDFAALRHCWHPVAYADALGRGAAAGAAAGRGPGAVARLGRHRARAARPLHPPRHGALARARGRGPDHVPVPRVAVRRRRRSARTSRSSRTRRRCPARRAWTRSPRSSATGTSGSRWRSRATRCRTSRSSSDPDWIVVQAGPYAWNSRRAAASSRTSPTSGTSRGCIPACSATPSGPSCPTTASRSTATSCATTSSAPRRPTATTSRSSATRRAQAPERRRRYQLHLPYTILLRLGWGGEKGMVYFFASQPVDEDHCIGYVTIARNYDREQPDSVLQDFEDTIFEQDRPRGRVPAARARAVRPRRRDAPEVRRGRDQLPQGDARAGPGEAAHEPRRRDRAS